MGRIFCDCEVVSYRAGEVIIRENTPAHNLYVNLRGKVKVVLDISNNPMDVVEFGPGNCLGEVSVIGILNHTASVVAVEDTQLLVISRRVLMDLFNYDKDRFSILLLNIARELARRLQRTDELLIQLGRKCAQNEANILQL